MVAKITIGIPVYNGENWLADTAESILQQTFTDFCLIISDNASTDRTRDIAETLAGRDSRVRYQRNAQNVGVFRNFDILFELCESPYFKWCSVGDRVHPSFLERASEVLDREPDVTLVYAGTRLIGSLAALPEIQEVDLSLVSRDPVSRYREYFARVRLNSPFHGLMRSDALARTGLNKRFPGSDECLIASLLLQGRFIRLPDELLLRRIETSTTTAAKARHELGEFYADDFREVYRFPTWKFQTQKFRDVLRAPVTFRQKVTLLGYLLRGVNWQRETLMREIVSAIGSARRAG